MPVRGPGTSVAAPSGVSDSDVVAVTDVLAARARLGESPVWDPRRQALQWVDIFNHWVHQFAPATGRDRTFDAGDVVSAIALADGDRLLLALRDRLAFLHLGSGR